MSSHFHHQPTMAGPKKIIIDTDPVGCVNVDDVVDIDGLRVLMIFSLFCWRFLPSQKRWKSCSSR